MCASHIDTSSAVVGRSSICVSVRAMMLAHASDCRLAQLSLHSCSQGQARLYKYIPYNGCDYSTPKSVRKHRSQGCRQRRETAVLASSVPQDVIDVEATLVDDRIPVTVSIADTFACQMVPVLSMLRSFLIPLPFADHHRLPGLRQDHSPERSSQAGTRAAHSSHRK